MATLRCRTCGGLAWGRTESYGAKPVDDRCDDCVRTTETQVCQEMVDKLYTKYGYEAVLSALANRLDREATVALKEERLDNWMQWANLATIVRRIIRE